MIQAPSRPDLTPNIPSSLLEAQVFGINLSSDTLQGNLAPDGTLLVFLRHFGCLFCREMVADLRQHAAAEGEAGRILIFYQGTVPEGRAFFTEHWPSARAIADQPLRFYQGLGIPKAGLGNLVSPAVWRRGMHSYSRGHRIGRIQGDVRQMPGLMWVRDGRILWRHDFEHAGDNPDVRRIPFLRESSALAA
jgi:hypothetical protein